ncbi:hypothetical protein GCM10009679_29030 [Saccharothrix algeriensis]|uniref:Uncharacterized protein n=1 Tax=Catellatospora bangladeshensis TaxID=310355 RepID=A0A8J3JED4_9ACTN|nr:hypothetical protein Cba03nite_42600 [Catellatospora bangladeshensis]
MNGSANPSGTATHTCPPVPSTGLSGGLIPHAVRPDRWCWAPDLGFHHRSAPHRRVQLRPAAGLLTRGHTIGVRRAVALGAGGAPADVAHAFSELEAWAAFTDADVFAELGHALSGLPGPDAAEHAARAVVLRALDRIDVTMLPTSWQGPLALAASGQGASPQEAARLRAVCDAAYRRLTRFETGWPPARTDRQAWWDYAAARACTALRDEDWTAAAHAVTDLYGLTGPAEEQATAWLRQVAATALPRVAG